MASKVERLRKAYEFKLGKKIVSKLSDEQIQILSSFYNSLSEDEQRSIDNDIFKGKTNDLIDMATAFAEENEEPPSAVATEEAPPPSGALALYEGTREDDLVDEEIDERILKLLGLEEVFDIDYGTYLTLLKEQMIADRMTDKKLSTEESELLTNEFRRVKGKVGRFKLKKKKIAAESLGVKGAITVSPQKFFLTSKAIIPETESTPVESSKDIKDISKSLDELLKSIRLDNEREKKKAEKERKEKEKAKRKAKEDELEKPVKKVLSAIKKVFAPFQSILDRIMRFIGFTLLGYFINKVLNWFANPENQKKVQVLGRFLKDWWPSLAFAAGLFLTPFGGFVRGTIRLIRTLLPRLINLIRLNPITSLAVAGAAGAAASAVMNEQKRKEFAATDPTIVTPKQTRETGKTPGTPQLQQEQILQRGLGSAFKGGGIIPRAKSFFGGGGVNNDVDINDIAYAEGGEIDNDSGLKITGAGPDTQLIAAQPGEIVMSKSAVDKYGANFFLDLNRKGGGTNIPKMVNNIQLAQGGGIIRNTIQKFQSGGMVGGKPSSISSNKFLNNKSNYGSNLKFKSPISGYPNYSKPSDFGGQFFAKIYNMAKSAGDPFPEVVAAQAIEESDFGRSALAKEANNLFGQDAPSDYPASKKYDYIDPIEGKHTAIKFSSIDESVKYRIKIWKKYYGGAKTPAEAIVNISKAGYNPHATYPGKIQNLLRDYGVVPNLPSPIKMYKSKVKPAGPKGIDDKGFSKFIPKPAGPKGIRESLSDDKGFSKFIPKPIRQLFGNQSSVNLQSQSTGSIQPVGTPMVSTKSQTIFLPPQQVASNRQDMPVKMGTQIPDFKPTANVPYRSMVLKSLGIDDLMGVG